MKKILLTLSAFILCASFLSAAPVLTWHQENIANPFSPDKGPILLRYDLASTTALSIRTSIKVYNMAGKLIRVILEGGVRPVGFLNTDSWDGKDDRGRVCLNGRYFLKVEVEDSTGKKQYIYSVALAK